jgi:hypothetical protein
MSTNQLYVKECRTATCKQRKANWIGYILRKRCLLKHVIEGNRKEEKTTKKTKAASVTLRERVILEFKQDSPDHAVKRTLWKRMWTSCTTNCAMKKLY